MTVAELIAELENYDEDLLVFIPDSEGISGNAEATAAVYCPGDRGVSII